MIIIKARFYTGLREETGRGNSSRSLLRCPNIK